MRLPQNREEFDQIEYGEFPVVNWLVITWDRPRDQEQRPHPRGAARPDHHLSAMPGMRARIFGQMDLQGGNCLVDVTNGAGANQWRGHHRLTMQPRQRHRRPGHPPRVGDRSDRIDDRPVRVLVRRVQRVGERAVGLRPPRRSGRGITALIPALLTSSLNAALRSGVP